MPARNQYWWCRTCTSWVPYEQGKLVGAKSSTVTVEDKPSLYHSGNQTKTIHKVCTTRLVVSQGKCTDKFKSIRNPMNGFVKVLKGTRLTLQETETLDILTKNEVLLYICPDSWHECVRKSEKGAVLYGRCVIKSAKDTTRTVINQIYGFGLADIYGIYPCIRTFLKTIARQFLPGWDY